MEQNSNLEHHALEDLLLHFLVLGELKAIRSHLEVAVLGGRDPFTRCILLPGRFRGLGVLGAAETRQLPRDASTTAVDRANLHVHDWGPSEGGFAILLLMRPV